jgi:hypothetical protein
VKYKKLPYRDWDKRYTIVYRNHFFNGDWVRVSASTSTHLYISRARKAIKTYWKRRFSLKEETIWDPEQKRVWIRGDDQ